MSRKHWPRWSFASFSRHFNDALAAEGITLFIEGQHRNTRELKDFAEFRFYGPRMLNVSKGCWRLRVEINILLQSVMNDTNFHEIHRMVGVVAEAFTTNIMGYKRGNGPDDDQQVFACFDLIQNPSTRNYLEIHHFGQIDKDTNLVQAAVEAHYTALVEEQVT